MHFNIPNVVKNRKIRTKLLLSYVFVVLLPVFLTSYFLIARIKETVLNQTRYINQISFNQLRDNMYHQLQEYLKLSDNIWMETEFTDYLSSDFSKNNSIMNVYIGFSNFMKAYNVKFLNSTDSTLVTFYSSNNSLLFNNKIIYSLDENIEEQGWCDAAITEKGGNSIHLYFNDPEKKYFITISRLISIDFAGKITNLFKIDIPESEIYKLMEKEGENKCIYLLDGNNNIVSATDRENIGKNAGSLDVFKGVRLNKSGNVDFFTGNENDVVYVSSFNDRSAIGRWKIVSFVTSGAIMKDINNIVIYGIITGSIIVMVAIVFVVIFSDTITRRLRALTRNMSKIRDGLFEVTVNYQEEDEIGELSKGFKRMVERINTLIEEVYKADMYAKDLAIKKKEAEIKALQSQINPHFLFNTMESIRMNLLKKNDLETSYIIQNFAKLLRKSIDWSQDIISLQQEASLVEAYMKIQKYRYRDRFNYMIDLDKDMLDYRIPKFTLQPIAENAIYHGLEMKNGAGTIKIYSICTDNDFRLVAQDDGIGIDSGKLKLIKEKLDNDVQHSEDENGSIGIVNVHQRIKLHYGENFGIKIESEINAGTRVEIILPLQNKEDHTCITS